jgi:uncharacterized protein YlxP (DUF503 family)
MATVVALLHLELTIVQAMNLKDKRRVLKSFKDRLGGSFNVSVAEVDRQDNCRYGVLAVAMVGSDRRYVEGAIQQVVNLAGSHRDMILTDHEIEWL